jgi:hypothetical protein
LAAVAEKTNSVEVPEPLVMVMGKTIAPRPADGLAVSMTVPVNPLMGVTVIVMLALSFTFSFTLVVPAVIVKSVMLNGSQAAVAGLLLASPA